MQEDEGDHRHREGQPRATEESPQPGQRESTEKRLLHDSRRHASAQNPEQPFGGGLRLQREESVAHRQLSSIVDGRSDECSHDQPSTRPRRSVPRETIRYADLNVPILVVWGEEDPLIRISTGEYYSNMLPDYRFVSIEGAGHFPMEEKPAEFLKHIRRFLGDHAERAESSVGSLDSELVHPCPQRAGLQPEAGCGVVITFDFPP